MSHQYEDITAPGPVYGPLSHQAPGQIPYHSYGVLAGLRPTPPQLGSTYNATTARQQYKRTNLSVPLAVQRQQRAEAIYSQPTPYHVASSSRQFPTSTHMNYIAPIPSSMRTDQIKATDQGKAAYKVGLPLNYPITTKTVNYSATRSSLQRARSGGCTAPRKKGSIYNAHLSNGRIWAWGSLPGQTY